MIRWINEIHTRNIGGKIFKKSLEDAEQARTKRLKTQFYKKPEELASKRNLCIILSYIKFKPIAYVDILSKEADEKRIKEIESWNGKFNFK